MYNVPRLVSFLSMFALVMGACFAFAGSAWILSSRQFVQGAHEASGVVVDLQGVSTRRHGTRYKHVVEYRTREGEVRTYTARIALRPALYSIGDTVPVHYGLRNPTDVRLGGAKGLWFWPSVLTGLGVLLMGVGFAGWLRPKVFSTFFGGG